MTTNQIYSVVNEITAQALGSNAMAAVDTSTFISLGNAVLSSSSNTESWLNTLAQRIFRTIVSERAYRNKLADMILTQDEFGAILQKIKISMPATYADPAWELTAGQSVDMYTVRKESVDQKLFVQRSPYLLEVTYPLFQLKEAFLSEAEMGRYIAAKTQEVRNKIETISEGMAKTTLATAAALAAGTSREVNLLQEYNTLTGVTITFDDAMHDEAFLRYAAQRINSYSDYLTEMSTLYNAGGLERHTPKDLQRLYMISDFDQAMKAQMQYAAFNPSMVEIGKHEGVGFWQSPTDRFAVDVTFNNTEYEVEGLLGILFDRDALGVYHDMEMVLTTPVNSKGAYYNTHYHMRRQWLIDQGENIIIFTAR